MTYLSALLQRPGAVAGTGRDAGVASHYGSPLPEQRALDRGLAVADLSQLGVVKVTGEDRGRWLHSLASQALNNLKPGDSTRSLFLTIQGRIDFDTKVLETEDSTLLITERESAAPLAAFLNSMRFMMRVEVTDETDHWAVLGARKALVEGALTWVDPWPHVGIGGFSYSGPQHPAEDTTWIEQLIPLEELDATVAALQAQGVSLAGTTAVEALRIADWKPRFGAETDEKTIPHELDLLRTSVHLAKGCYKGQETIARVHNLGHPPRRLVFLHLDGSEHTLPEPGSEVHLDGRNIGKITTSALHYEAGPIALALIKRAVDPEATLEIVEESGAKSPATQEVIVSTDAGQVVGRAKGFIKPPTR
ncbi:CAF17-like 4Fe-4S cluster assembly/insertion protein YgfZ [Neomicrococcus lactis]|uniref:GCVT N-terminal domain-containing protein n=1 Tax=Neomicrococcus lactis TaxID=732241 RepID=A0A7W8Y8Q0_9MICC|nr:hypothetical protein [Neomicrococcus lactis]